MVTSDEQPQPGSQGQDAHEALSTTAGTAAASPPADWYDDPRSDGLRYWDGSAWTEHVARVQPAVPTLPDTPGDGGSTASSEDPGAKTSDQTLQGGPRHAEPVTAPSQTPSPSHAPDMGSDPPLRRLASSSVARRVIDLAMVLALVAVIVVGITTRVHQASVPTPIVEASGATSTTTSPPTTNGVPTTQAVPTTVPTTEPTTVPTTAAPTVPPPAVAPATVAPTTVPVSVPRTTSPPTTVVRPAPPQTLLIQSNEGGEITTPFTVPSNAATWDVHWTYNCSNNGGVGNFVVNVLEGGGIDASDAGVNQLGSGGSGTQDYHDQGSFSLQISSECIWSIQVAIPG